MALPAGARLGPYEVEHLLGAGGMGEVYRGLDRRLGRAVALKVISQRLVGDEASRRRFETEARAASALNHPAIVTIYDIGESEDVSWIAMELVEGRTLRDVIAQGPLPIRQAWSIARQLADGLAAAHAKGIVHRDLKPENVMVTDEGAVKILDFGVARRAVASPLDDAAAAATVTGSGTVAGVILGTVGYMSPEQATGQTADFRSDQFSFGAVIYEVLTGQCAFRRPSPVETLTAILRDEPLPLASIRNDTSEAFQRVIGRCLEKSPAQRFTSTRELAAALEALTPESSAAVSSTGPGVLDRRGEAAGKPALSRLWVAIAALAILVVAAVILASMWSTQVDVPSVVGQPLNQAMGSIAAAKLITGNVTHEPSPESALGTVLRQEPASGATATRGTAVALVVAVAPLASPSRPSTATDQKSDPSSILPDPTGGFGMGIMFEVSELGLQVMFAGDESSVAALLSGAKGPGGVVMRVSTGPVQKAGLRAGDVITKIAGVPIAAENDLRVALQKIGPGITSFTIRRGEAELTLKVDCPVCKRS